MKTTWDIKLLREFGARLGQQAYEQNKERLLYQLRNCKNKAQLLELLCIAQSQLQMIVDNSIVKYIAKAKNSTWRGLKALICIYAVNAFIKASSSDTTSEQQGETKQTEQQQTNQ